MNFAPKIRTPKGAARTIAFLAALVCSQANSSVADESVKFDQRIARNPTLQRAIVSNYSLQTYGQCRALSMKFMTDQANGLRLTDEVTTFMGLMFATTSYYRKSSGIPSKALDDTFSTYWSVARANPDQYVTKNAGSCAQILQKITSEL